MSKSNGKYMVNRKGDKVPISAVHPVDRKRERLVQLATRRWMDEFERLAKLREDLFSRVDDFLAYSAERSGAEKPPTKNVTITNYAGTKRVRVKTRDFIEFDERLTMAEEIIMDLILEWSDGAKDVDKLNTAIRAAFRRDKEGNVDRLRILSLQKLQIRDRKWRQAMDLINESRTVQETRPYIMLQIRNQKTGKWESLPLQLATADMDELKRVKK